MKLVDHVDDERVQHDDQLHEQVEQWRQDFRRAQQRLDTASAKFEEARPAFHKALVDVELFGSEPVRQAAGVWAKDIEERYEWLFQTGEYWPEEVHKMREGELRQHREPFIELVRSQLGIQPKRSLRSWLWRKNGSVEA